MWMQATVIYRYIYMHIYIYIFKYIWASWIRCVWLDGLPKFLHGGAWCIQQLVWFLHWFGNLFEAFLRNCLNWHVETTMPRSFLEIDSLQCRKGV